MPILPTDPVLLTLTFLIVVALNAPRTLEAIRLLLETWRKR